MRDILKFKIKLINSLNTIVGMGIKYILFNIIILLALFTVPYIFMHLYAELQNSTSPSLSNFTDNEVIHQKTVSSTPASVSVPGLKPHEVVFALPLRDDGKIWSGTVTFTASKPIEVEILHNYNPKDISNLHDEPYNAVIGDKRIAISQLRNIVELPLTINNSQISSGTFDFVGSALVFHKTDSTPFSITYSLDAMAKDITP